MNEINTKMYVGADENMAHERKKPKLAGAIMDHTGAKAHTATKATRRPGTEYSIAI
ncbi:MAG TPA: hypothetical protein V6D22_15395 [Candidatus Obscuribacterales bacterium]